MGKYPGKILLSDLDGTLFDANSRVSQRNKEAISAFVEGGGRFGIAMGRIWIAERKNRTVFTKMYRRTDLWADCNNSALADIM